MKHLSIFIGLVLILALIFVTIDFIQTWQLMLVPIEVVELKMPTHYNYSKLEYVETISVTLRYAIATQGFIIIVIGCLLHLIYRFELYNREQAIKLKRKEDLYESIVRARELSKSLDRDSDRANNTFDSINPNTTK
jgi:hypothetical protein